MSQLKIETREVLAAAYVRRNTAMYTHAVSVNGDGIALSVFCDRVKLDNIADRNSGNDLWAEPTCKTCRRSWRVYKEKRPDVFKQLGELPLRASEGEAKP